LNFRFKKEVEGRCNDLGITDGIRTGEISLSEEKEKKKQQKQQKIKEMFDSKIKRCGDLAVLPTSGYKEG